MRTTIDLDDSVLAALRDRSKREGKTLGALASELIARSLEQSDALPDFEWQTGDMRARVDIDDREALAALLAADDRPR